MVKTRLYYRALEDTEPDRLQKGLALTFCFLRASFVFVSSGHTHSVFITLNQEIYSPGRYR